MGCSALAIATRGMICCGTKIIKQLVTSLNFTIERTRSKLNLNIEQNKLNLKLDSNKINLKNHQFKINLNNPSKKINIKLQD
jgi:hypothetical protein